MPRYELFALVLLPVFVLMTAWLDVALPAESDKAWLLHVARLWLEGHTLYGDVVEVNPPLIVWLYSIPVWISLHVPWIQDYEALGIIGLAACALSIRVCVLLIRRHPAFAGSPLRQAEFALLLGVVLVFYVTQIYFFDRDHIFLVLTFPYMLRFMPSLAAESLSLRFRLLIGGMAALGFCIKPHTIVVFAALQLFALVRTRSLVALFTVENNVIAGMAMLYLLCVVQFTPDYFTQIVPLAIATYSEFANHGQGWAYVPPIIFSLLLVFADFRPRHVTPYRRDVYYLLGLCAAFIAYSLSNNGWGYTYCPMYCITLFTTGWMLWEYEWFRREHVAHQRSRRSTYFGIRSCFIVFIIHSAYTFTYLFVMATSGGFFPASCGQDPDCWHKRGAVVSYVYDNHIHSFGTLSLDFGKWVMLLRLPDVQWDTRFNHLWMLPQVINGGAPSIKRLHWVLEYVGKSLAEDLNHRKPEIMFDDTSPGFMGLMRRFDYPVFLSRIPEFKEAWSHYRYSYTIDTCGAVVTGIPSECRYDVYTRIQ